MPVAGPPVRLLIGLDARGALPASSSPDSLPEFDVGFAGSGPSVATRGPLSVVADARIDNPTTLQALAGAPENAEPAALILAAFERWGSRCVERIEGDFAFAAWDRRTQTLLLARDAMGMRPLYYHRRANQIFFSNDLFAVHELARLPRHLQRRSAAEFLCHRAIREDRTLLSGVQRLLPAHCLESSPRGVRVWRYWEPDLERELRLPRSEDYVAGYREHLDRAVRARVSGTQGVACFLSGGLDSPAIAALAARTLAEQGGQPLTTISFVVDPAQPGPPDERGLIDSVLAVTPHVSPHFLSSTGRSYADGGRARPLPLHPMLQASFTLCRERAANVLLGGFGGDQLATSQARSALPELLRLGQVRTAWGLCQAQAAAGGPRPLRGLASGLRRAALRGDVPDPRRLWRERLQRALISPHLAPLVEHYQHWCQPRATLRESQWQALSAGAADQVADAINAHLVPLGIDYRLPFLDKALVEYCLSVPPEEHRWARGRWLIRRMTEGVLPDSVRLRNDKSVPAPPDSRRLLARNARWLLAEVDSIARRCPEAELYVDLQRLRARLVRLAASPEVPPPAIKTMPIDRAYTILRLLDWCATAPPQQSPPWVKAASH